MKLPTVKRGDTWNLVFVWKNDNTPIDLSDCTAKMQIRHKRTGVVLAEVTTTSGITITGPEGRVNVSFPTTATSTVEAGVHETDLQITFTTSGEVQSSDTLEIPVVEDVTR
jgi:hypothetical protein